MSNVDSAELAKFAARAASGGIRTGRSRRCTRSTACARITSPSARALSGARVLDVGCGGGMLSEALAERGAAVARDRSRGAKSRRGARARRRWRRREWTIAASTSRRSHGSGRQLRRRHLPRDARARARAEPCRRGVRGAARTGRLDFFSTLNRNPKSFALAIVGAEYVLGLLPRGTHEYLEARAPVGARPHGAAARALDVAEITGLHSTRCCTATGSAATSTSTTSCTPTRPRPPA